MNHKVRVLIVDDERATGEGLTALLALTPDMKVVGVATQGADALRLVARRQPDVVLMDMQMPVMDGVEATRRIKGRWPEVKVIALTLYADYRHRALLAGADRFLLKGTPLEILRRAILEEAEAARSANANTDTSGTVPEGKPIRNVC